MNNFTSTHSIQLIQNGPVARKLPKLFIALCLICGLLLTTSGAQIQDNEAAPAKSESLRDAREQQQQALVGTWATVITPPPDSGVPAFPGFFTFTSDGNLIATQAGGPIPALGNPQLGLWKHNGGRRFTITYFTQQFDEHFQLVGSDEEHAVISLNFEGDHFKGILDTTVYDNDGNVIFSACCATFEGKRLKVKPPQKNSHNVDADSAVPSQTEAETPGQGLRGWGRMPPKK